MALFEAGTRETTVVFDAGLGDSSASWDVVQSEISRFAHAVSYDRAGRGQSHFVPGSRTSLDIANDLRAMLEAAQIPGPYILVGHSFGGYNIRVFADRFPDLVAGLILVDSSHEFQAQAFGNVLSNVELILERSVNPKRWRLPDKNRQPLPIHCIRPILLIPKALIGRSQPNKSRRLEFQIMLR